MPSFNIVKEINPSNSFRVESIKGNFDLELDHCKEVFKGNIDIEGKEWNIGLIVGGSGTGKSTIAKEVFGENYFSSYKYTSKSVIDDMPKNKKLKDIELAFTSVGFASPPSWLKPYDVLSNGEKMRVDLARNILEENEIIVFDEFTSVVNREVAKTSSYAISKAIRKQDKKFIAVACHKDIIDWLEPDWIYDTDKKEFFFYPKTERPKRPNIELEIYRVNNKLKARVWNIFKKYHYLNGELHKACDQYVGIINGEIVCHTGVIQFPMRKGWKRVHRLVVLPDYQGIGIGTKFIKEIAEIYINKGYDFNLTTTTPSLVNALRKNKNWLLARFGRSKGGFAGFSRKYGHSEHLANAKSDARITFSFNYKKIKYEH